MYSLYISSCIDNLLSILTHAGLLAVPNHLCSLRTTTTTTLGPRVLLLVLLEYQHSKNLVGAARTVLVLKIHELYTILHHHTANKSESIVLSKAY